VKNPALYASACTSRKLVLLLDASEIVSAGLTCSDRRIAEPSAVNGGQRRRRRRRSHHRAARRSWPAAGPPDSRSSNRTQPRSCRRERPQDVMDSHFVGSLIACDAVLMRHEVVNRSRCRCRFFIASAKAPAPGTEQQRRRASTSQTQGCLGFPVRISVAVVPVRCHEPGCVLCGYGLHARPLAHQGILGALRIAPCLGSL
jgi:hypothetical protein